MAENEAISDELKLIIFKLGREEYGMDILKVQEIKRMMSITRVPSTPSYIKGVINLRGSILPVIDLRTRLGLLEADLTEAARIIVLLVNEVIVGFIVDEVVEVTTINPENVEAANVLSSGLSTEYISGIAKAENRLYIMLNPDTIVNIAQA
ncbi:MAG TPA: chemotaxis protein CheW [Negativicutes bacterium]|nr:chemotaxis protein CheW [Negativicutes bacterium]